MKFDINGKDLAQCISTLIKAIPSKTSLPLLECFHFVAEDGEWVELITRGKYTPTHWRHINIK